MNTFKKETLCVSSACSKDASRPHITGICFDGEYAMATNGCIILRVSTGVHVGSQVNVTADGVKKLKVVKRDFTLKECEENKEGMPFPDAASELFDNKEPATTFRISVENLKILCAAASEFAKGKKPNMIHLEFGVPKNEFDTIQVSTTTPNRHGQTFEARVAQIKKLKE